MKTKTVLPFLIALALALPVSAAEMASANRSTGSRLFGQVSWIPFVCEDGVTTCVTGDHSEAFNAVGLSLIKTMWDVTSGTLPIVVYDCPTDPGSTSPSTHPGCVALSTADGVTIDGSTVEAYVKSDWPFSFLVILLGTESAADGTIKIEMMP